MSCHCGTSTTGCACGAGRDSGSLAGPGAVGRLSHRDGQRLASRDLRDEAARDAFLRRWHIRYQHGTWGIALGLGVDVGADAQTVEVGPGYAVDAEGEDLVLGTSLVLPVPDVAGPEWLVLVARAEPEVERRGISRPVFVWRRPSDVSPGVLVPLAAAQILGGQVQGGLDTRPRRYARKLSRPRIGSGSTDPGGTQWRAWKGQDDMVLGLEVVVSTAEAGFLANPHYIAVLEPPSSGAGAPSPLRPVGWIASASADEFTFQVAAGAPELGLDVGPEQAREAGWSVTWLGIEPWGGSVPLASGTPIFIADLASLLVLFGAASVDTSSDETAGGNCS